MREGEVKSCYRDRKRELNHQLYEKVQSELAFFHKDMLGRTPDEIYESAYEIVARHEIAAAFSGTDYPPAGVKALLKSPNLLDGVYKEWQEQGALPPGGLKALIEEYRKSMVKKERVWSGQER